MPEPGPPLNVLIVDDHDIVRLGVRHLLGEQALVHEAATLADARALLARSPFRLLILDLGLGDEFSLTALPQIRRDHPGLKIIVLTSMAEELYAERALRAGADGYVMKTELAQTLAAAVAAVLAGDVHVSPRLRSTLLRRVAGGPAAAAGPELSPREIEVLRLVGQGRSTREIAELLNRSVKTIETHKQALKDKLGAESPAMLIKIALAWCGDAP
ncbi:MAG: response regulator transcription factor [Burkholderiales bacterium]|nr:response regulator transcription factor [Burkholderiales bacterium]MDE1928877.1 response regulator transcription factor [Burkholderiales bacterium]MDE2158425.1 response regulator transcription factor [Burkholderiales bacterium]MDE2503842.1 response regulator transcription factor [Burkholderiales bacterium]